MAASACLCDVSVHVCVREGERERVVLRKVDGGVGFGIIYVTPFVLLVYLLAFSCVCIFERLLCVCARERKREREHFMRVH